MLGQSESGSRPAKRRQMQPEREVLKRVVRFVVMILAFVVSVSFGEYYRGLGWLGALIFVFGASAGALAIHLSKVSD